MGNLKDKKGFTLVELLAVIVILGIVTVIGVTTILPYMQNAQKDAFVDEANYVIDAATNAVTLIQIGTIKNETANEFFKHTEAEGSTNEQYCFTLEQLVKAGLWTKDQKALGNGSNQYEGKVIAEKQTTGYTYKVSMTNHKYWINSTGGQITNDNVANSAPSGWSTSC